MNSLALRKSHRREEPIRLRGMTEEEGRSADLAGIRIGNEANHRHADF